MLKAYRNVERLYINGDLVHEYRRNIMLLEDDEVKEFAHTEVYNDETSIRTWWEEEYGDIVFPRISYDRGFFSRKFKGLYVSEFCNIKGSKYYSVNDYPDFNVKVENFADEINISINQVLDIKGDRAIQYLLERGITMLKELT